MSDAEAIRAAKAARLAYYDLSAYIGQLPAEDPLRVSMQDALIRLWACAREAFDQETRDALGNLGGPR